MIKAEPNSCCGKCTSALNLEFEACFDGVGRCIFSCPLPILLLTLVFYGVCCIFVSEIESAEDIKELILGDNSLLVRIAEWRDVYLSTSNWGLCLTEEPTASPTRFPTLAPTCVDDPSGLVAANIGSCAVLASMCSNPLQSLSAMLPATMTIGDVCPVTCEMGCGAIPVRRLLSDKSRRRATCTGASSSDLAIDGSIGSMTIMGIDRNKENILTAEYLLEYMSFLKRFLKDWNTTCDEFEGKVFGYKDVAVLEWFDSSYEAVAEFPIRNNGLLRCFQEGWWSSYENPLDVLMAKNTLSYNFEYARKDSLQDIYDSDTSSEVKLDDLTTAIHKCWIYAETYQLTFSFTIGGTEYREYTAEEVPVVGDEVMANIGTNDWRAGVIGSVWGNYFIVVSAALSSIPLGAFPVTGLRRKVSKAIGVQSIFPIAVHDQFARRVQRKHYDFCDTTGDLNGTYDCTNDDNFDWILEGSKVCHRKIVDDMAEAIRRANNEEDISIEIAMFTPFDEENILDYVSDTSEVMVVICLCIMIVFIGAIALNPCDPRQSKAMIGSLGVVLVYFSTMAGMGLCRMVFRKDFTPAALQALPFMGLGLGVDDMLVLLWTYKYQPSKLQIKSEICRAVREAGLSITLTSMTNFLAFIVGTQMPLNELSYFSVTAACVMFTNYIGIVFAFSSLLVLHNRCRASSQITRRDSIIAKIGNKVLGFGDDDEAAKENLGFTKVKEVSEKALGLVPSALILIISLMILCVSLFVSPSPEWGVSLNDLIPDDHPMKSFFENWEEYFNTMPATFGFGFVNENGQPDVYWGDHYELKYRDIKSFYEELNNVSTMHFTVTWLRSFEEWVTSDPTSTAVIPGEDTTPVTPLRFIDSTGNPMTGECSADEVALCYPSLLGTCFTDDGCSGYFQRDCNTVLQDYIVEGGSADYCGEPVIQLLECPEYRFGGGACYSASTANYQYVGRAGVCVTPPALSEEEQTRDEGPYYTPKDEELDKEGCMEWCDLDENCIGIVYWMWPVVEDSTATLEPRGCRLFNNVSECTNVDSAITTSDGAVSLYKTELATHCTTKSSWFEDEDYQDNCFMDLLRLWATETDAKDYWAKELIWSSGNSNPGPLDYLVGAESSSLISTGAMGAQLTGAETVDAIEDTRAVAENYADLGAYVTGILYEYYDQLFEVHKYLVPSLLYVTIAVFCCSLLFILHPIAAFLMLVSLVITLVELWGFLRWADIKVNGVLALNMVIACGVCVEFTAHINRRFMLAKGTPRERLGISLGVLFIPVTLGAATSIIAVSFMAFSDNPYTRIYYFRLFSTMIALGWWNGTFFQSVLILAVAKCLEGTCFEMATISRGAQNEARNPPLATDPGDGLEMTQANAMTSDASAPETTRGEGEIEGEI